MRRDELAKHLNDITPAQLETYMLSHGWFRDGDFKGLASIWHRSGTVQSDAELLLPSSASAKDFADRMVDAVIAISLFEDRSFLTVLKEVMGHFADLVRIRVFHNDVDAGTIPINDGVLLNIRARDLMASAVMSTASKRRHFMGKRSPEVKAYIDSLRLGQTEVGSYIVNIIAPVGPSQSDQGSFEDVPLSNIVTANLASSLEALTFAIDEFSSVGDLTVFDAAVGCVAVVHAATLADLLIILLLGSLYDKLDVYNLCLTDYSVRNAIQRATAAFAVGWLMLYDSVWRTDRLQGASLVSRLSTAWLATRLAQGFRPAKFASGNALLRWRNTAVAAILLRLF